MRMDSAKPHGWGGVAAMSVLALVIAVLGLVLVQGDVRAAGTFEPSADVELSNYDSSVNADVTTTFSVPGTDLNYAALVSFTPPEFFPGEDVPIGAKVGELDAVATLGLLNMPCNTPLGPHFDLYLATTDTSTTCTLEGQFANDPLPNPPYTPGMHASVFDCYPDFALRMLPGITPLSRMYGYANVSGSDVTINFIVLEAGALPGYPAALGRPSVTILNDIGDPGAAPTPGNPITDFCTPLSSDTVTFGLSQDNSDTPDIDESGYEVRRNPSYGGTYTFHWEAESFRNADDDDYENYIDTCPFIANVDGSPKEFGSDPDGDCIDSACENALRPPDWDPTKPCWPDAPGNFQDCDGDGYYNCGDNCPLVANGALQDNQADGDTDDIGNACDPHATTPDGESITWSADKDVEISGPAVGEDSDGDGFDDVTELNLGSCPSDPCSDYFCSGVKADKSTPEHTTVAGTCTDGKDNDLDGYVDDVDGGCAQDTDEDGVSDEGEEDLGSDPENAASTPEDASVCDVCTDGKDNDGDGLKDAADPGCAVTVTPTGTPTAGTATPVVTATPTPTPAGEVKYCPPVFPGTYYGLVRINGQPANGYQVTAKIKDLQWASATVSGGRYAMDIPDHLPAEPPCFEGGTITFELNGMICTPAQEGADEWAAGLQNVDLNCAPPMTPTPTLTPAAPTATASPTATATATPTAATPTATPIKPTPTPTPVPVKLPPGGGGGLAGPSQGLPVWAIALASWAGLTIVAGLGTLVRAKRR